MNRFHDLLTKRRIIRRGLSDETFTSQEISGWYKIFELPFEPVWKVPIMVFAFYYTIIVLYTSSYRRLPDMLGMHFYSSFYKNKNVVVKCNDAFTTINK